jgi:hypothetical protein
VTIQQLRDAVARRGAIDLYHDHYDQYADRAQLYVGSAGDLAGECAKTAWLFLCAADAEIMDPPPRSAPDCQCPAHRAYLALPVEVKGPPLVEVFVDVA